MTDSKPSDTLRAQVSAVEKKNEQLHRELEAARDALKEVYALLSYHTDDEAEEDDPQPEEMTPHINGICRQKIKAALAKEADHGTA